jgi:choline transporter-like protein 2/4/5
MNKPMWRTLMMIMRYHFGSLVFGSLVLLIVQFFEFILELIFFIHSWKYHDANACFKTIDGCLQWFYNLGTKVTSRLNRFAYIQIALRGKNYI